MTIMVMAMVMAMAIATTAMTATIMVETTTCRTFFPTLSLAMIVAITIETVGDATRLSYQYLQVFLFAVCLPHNTNTWCMVGRLCCGRIAHLREEEDYVLQSLSP
mmetsp:Transcript_12805/g.25640  ORF Transcript_12805/g.25640 Transcript_12805/m.25640 type:complete len:105 (+) Transcript_12805:1262-1576(+)